MALYMHERMKRLIWGGIVGLIVCWLVSCGKPPRSRNEMASFAINNAGDVAFSFFHQNREALYLWTAADQIARQITAPNGESAFLHPSFSRDGRQLVFIRYTSRAPYICEVWVLEVHRSAPRVIASIHGIVRQVIFDDAGADVFCIVARDYAAYSPLAGKAPHGFDLFRVGVDDGKIQQVTSLNAYEMSGLTPGPDGTVLCRIVVGERAGIYRIDPDRPDAPQPLELHVAGRPDRMLYFSPDYSVGRRELLFVVPYEIYVSAIESGEARLVFSNVGKEPIEQVRWFGNQVMFSTSANDRLYVLPLLGGEVRELSLTFPTTQGSR